MSDYTWRQRGNKLHAFSPSSNAGMSLCRAVRGTATQAPHADCTRHCINCARVVARAAIAAEVAADAKKRRADVLAELEAAPPEPEVFLDRTRVPALQPIEELQEAVLAEVSAHVPKASSQRLTTLVASRIAVRELRDELKAIEEGLSKRFVLAHRKLDALEQVFEALTKEIAP